MRVTHYLASAATVALIAGLAASPAKAEVEVSATIDKTKNVTVTENIIKTKVITVVGTQVTDIERSAESLAIANQELFDNTALLLGGNDATIDNDSVDGNAGAVQFNNAAGFLNQQGNVLSAAVDAGGGDTNGFADAQASAEQNLYENTVLLVGGNTAETDDSITNNSGVVHGNNAAGVMNQQLNVLSLAAAFSDPGQEAIALAEADLGQTLTENTVLLAGGNTATISGSISGNTGLVGYNQASGSLNQQGNVLAISATSSGAALFE